MKQKFKITILICTVLLLVFPSVSAFSIYDVNFDTSVNVQDATETWSHRGSTDILYDVNSDGIVDVRDVTEIWAHRGDPSSIPEIIFEWFSDVIW